MKKFLKMIFALLTAAVTVFFAGCSEQAVTEINMTEEELRAYLEEDEEGEAEDSE